MKRFLWGLQLIIILLVSFPLSLLPVKAGEFFGLSLCRLWRSRRLIALDNLKSSLNSEGFHTSKTPEEIIKENFKNLGRSFMEIVKIYHGMGKGILERISIKGMENFEKARTKSKGVMFITGHCGNWELLAIALSVKDIGLSVVARPLDNPYLNRLVEKTRSRYGNRVIYKKGALKGIITTFKNNGFVGILMDQAVLSDEGYVIDFLGRGAWTTKMPALIARKTEVPVVPVFIKRTANGHEITLYPEVRLSSNTDPESAVIEDTKTFSQFIEDYIKEHPSEWLWIHRRWKRAPI